MYAEVAWVLVSSGTQVRPQIIFDPDYLSDYLSVSYDYGRTQNSNVLANSEYIYLQWLPKTEVYFCILELHTSHVLSHLSAGAKL